jgi:protein-tyrosine phosphatase/arsenate reductase
MHISIKSYCQELEKNFNEISDERKILLQKLADYIKSKNSAEKPIQLVYICTHNSRRSHFGQVWSAVAACYYNIEKVSTFSGGTEATAFNISAINALKRIGFIITDDGILPTPKYTVEFGNNQTTTCFSKVYDHPANPQKEFAAIMTCSDAEENCPFIPGVELRIGTTYNDPKAFDNTPLQDEKYSERCRQIALECMYVFSLVN